MPERKANKVLRVILSVVALLILGCAGFAFWLSHHYKQLIMERLPEMVAKSSDSIYHISFSDVSVSLKDHTVTITDIKLKADEKQAAALRPGNTTFPLPFQTLPYQE